MVVLSLETATRQGSAALLIGDACDARIGDATRTHGERLPEELLRLLASHDLSLRDVDLFAIVAGPGSFTGLRVGMAAVQGLALVTGRHVVPIPTLEIMAEGWRMDRASGLRPPAADLRPQASGRKPQAAGTERVSPEARGPKPEAFSVIVCLDGQRGDVFFAAWELRLDDPIDVAITLIEPSVGTARDLVDRVGREEWTPSCIVGLALDRHLPILAELRAPVEAFARPLADVAARMAARRSERALPPHALRPIYVRRPDAVLARDRAGLSR